MRATRTRAGRPAGVVTVRRMCVCVCAPTKTAARADFGRSGRLIRARSRDTTVPAMCAMVADHLPDLTEREMRSGRRGSVPEVDSPAVRAGARGRVGPHIGYGKSRWPWQPTR